MFLFMLNRYNLNFNQNNPTSKNQNKSSNWNTISSLTTNSRAHVHINCLSSSHCRSKVAANELFPHTSRQPTGKKQLILTPPNSSFILLLFFFLWVRVRIFVSAVKILLFSSTLTGDKNSFVAKGQIEWAGIGTPPF